MRFSNRAAAALLLSVLASSCGCNSIFRRRPDPAVIDAPAAIEISRIHRDKPLAERSVDAAYDVAITVGCALADVAFFLLDNFESDDRGPTDSEYFWKP